MNNAENGGKTIWKWKNFNIAPHMKLKAAGCQLHTRKATIHFPQFRSDSNTFIWTYADHRYRHQSVLSDETD